MRELKEVVALGSCTAGLLFLACESLASSQKPRVSQFQTNSEQLNVSKANIMGQVLTQQTLAGCASMEISRQLSSCSKKGAATAGSEGCVGDSKNRSELIAAHLGRQYDDTWPVLSDFISNAFSAFTIQLVKYVQACHQLEKSLTRPESTQALKVLQPLNQTLEGIYTIISNVYIYTHITSTTISNISISLL